VRCLRSSHPDATIVGFDMGYFGHCMTAAELFPESRTDVQYFGDVRRPLSKDVLAGVDVVVHLAAISNDPMGSAFEAITDHVNHRASVAVAVQAKAAGTRAFVFASSCSVYGCADGGPRTEESPVGPLTAYARSKVAAEQALTRLADESFTVTSLRFATACGMSDRLRLDLVLNDFIAGAVASKTIKILSDGTPWRPLIHVSDMARAIDWAIQRPCFESGAFLAINVGSDAWNYQVKELAETAASMIGGVTVSMNHTAAPDKRSYRVSFAKFKQLAPAFQPQMTLHDTITELMNGLEAMGFNNAAFRTSTLMRLEVLKELRRRGHLTESLTWTHRPADAETAGIIEAGAAAPLAVG
jgi:nucleoside-diphosphate-sugar epimerase